MRVIRVRRYFGDTIAIGVWRGVISLSNPLVIRSNSGSGRRGLDGGDCIWRCDLSNKTDHDTRMLADRKTRLKFHNFLLDWVNIDNRIGQGDPLLMILFIFYNVQI
jgi:hypothetical protein